jgi:hypothetical protein
MAVGLSLNILRVSIQGEEDLDFKFCEALGTLISKCEEDELKKRIMEEVLMLLWSKHFSKEISEDRALEIADTLKFKTALPGHFAVLMKAMLGVAKAQSYEISVLEVLIFMINDEFDADQ